MFLNPEIPRKKEDFDAHSPPFLMGAGGDLNLTGRQEKTQMLAHKTLTI